MSQMTVMPLIRYAMNRQYWSLVFSRGFVCINVIISSFYLTTATQRNPCKGVLVYHRSRSCQTGWAQVFILFVVMLPWLASSLIRPLLPYIN